MPAQSATVASPAGDEDVGTERPPQAREDDGEPLPARHRRVVAPQGGDQPVTRDGPRVLQGDVGEGEPPLARWQCRLPPAPVHNDCELTTELDRYVVSGQAPSKQQPSLRG